MSVTSSSILKLGEYNSEVLLNLVVDGPDHRDAAGDALLGGSKDKEVSQTMVLEVGLIEGPEQRVCVEMMCISGNIYQHDGANKRGRRNSIS